ncbi:MAG: hypothetical protein RL684_3313 [Pseudomonadota bacterium]|jgi:hypothetical protein
MSSPARPKVSFTVFFVMWAQLQRWEVPELHIRICHWLEHCRAPVRELLVFRGAAKSTIYAVYKAWRLYCNPTRRSLIWAADDKLATKLTRDTINVLRRHPLCGGMLPTKPGAQSFWVTGATDMRNPSMEAVGVSSNATGSRADDVDFDDIEVPKNIKTAEARANLRNKIEDATHIAVPGSQATYIGTPHTHDSIYVEQQQAGAEVLKIPLFAHIRRYQPGGSTRFPFDFKPGPDGLYVLVGIGKFSQLLREGPDYQVRNGAVEFATSPQAVVDICAGCAWPERFTRADILQRRRGTRTLNAWDSQYHLEAKPIEQTRLDPSKLRIYEREPTIRDANGELAMFLGQVRIAGAVGYWDCSLGKLKSDASAFTLLLTDHAGQLYWHRAVGLTGELADFADNGELRPSQCLQIRKLVTDFQIPMIYVETNGPGGFVPPILRRALRGTGCAVTDVWSTVNKNKRILDALEPPMSTRFLWAHTSVANGPVWDQMKDFSPESKNQPDDYLDSVAGAITQTPVRIGKSVRNLDTPARKDWRRETGTHEVTFER